jgi:hypothetical protein
MSQGRLFEGFEVVRFVVDLPGWGEDQVNVDDPPEALAALFPDGRLPRPLDQVELTMRAALGPVSHGPKVDKLTGHGAESFPRRMKFVAIRDGFHVNRVISFNELEAEWASEHGALT